MANADDYEPFSPRWLALRGRYDEFLEVLKKIHDNQEDHTFYEKEFHQIRAQIQKEKEEKVGIISIFTKKSYARRVGPYCTLLLCSAVSSIPGHILRYIS